jgi:2-polyprenyl-3-methyl-5-hydroxy-6-metoxy-1,4-benzoquinol methylase
MPVRIDPEEREIAALSAMVPAWAGLSVLEVGCGDGRLTRRYAHAARSVLAIDPDHANIAALRADPPRGPVDARAIAFDRLDVFDRRFDIVLLSWSL